MTRKEIELMGAIVAALECPGDIARTSRARALLDEIAHTADRIQAMPRVDHGVPQ